MHGFTESLNVGVASGLVLQALIAADPSIRGQLLAPGRAQQLADKWRAAAARGAKETWPGATVTQAQAKQRRAAEQQQQLAGFGGDTAAQLQPCNHVQQQQQAAGGVTGRQQAQHEQQHKQQPAAEEASRCLHKLQLQEQPHAECT
jgi:hypothetical protein